MNFFNQFVKSFVVILAFAPISIFAQETNYFFNKSETATQEWDLNKNELTDITYSVKIPPIAYEFDLVTLNVYKIVDDEVRRFDYSEYGIEYTRLKLKNESSGILTGKILNSAKEYLKGDFSRINGNDFIDKEEKATSFFVGLYGFEINGYEERYNSYRNVYEKYPVYNSGTLINNKKIANVYQKDGWEQRKANRLKKQKEENEAAAKKERRNTFLTYGIGGAIGILVVVLLYA